MSMSDLMVSSKQIMSDQILITALSLNTEIKEAIHKTGRDELDMHHVFIPQGAGLAAPGGRGLLYRAICI